MKVKVRKIAAPYTDVPTESLQAILRNHAHDKLLVQIGTKQLYDIMAVLAERNKESGRVVKSNKEAWVEFEKHYMLKKPSQLTIDYAGGFDHCLLELSDVLLASCYVDTLG